ncbi:MAG: hypothetical protein AAF252_12980 [Pseudomonadota bacterium]
MLEVNFQGADVLRLFMLASVFLSLCSYVPYIRDTLAGRTHPHRASWLIWSVLSSVALWSQMYEAETGALWFAAVQVGGTVTIFILSIRRGQGAICQGRDLITLGAALVGLILWALTDTPAYALAITIFVSLLGGSVTVLKAYRAPETETLSKWFLCCIASWFAILSIGQANWVLLAYPVYLFTLNGAIIMAIMWGRAMRTAHPMFPAE